MEFSSSRIIQLERNQTITTAEGYAPDFQARDVDRLDDWYHTESVFSSKKQAGDVMKVDRPFSLPRQTQKYRKSYLLVGVSPPFRIYQRIGTIHRDRNDK